MLEIAKIIDQKLQYPCIHNFTSYHWDDGTLKDASKLEWPNSPSDLSPYTDNPNPGEENVILKRKPLGDEDDSGYENAELPKAVKVSCNSL